jgi:cell division transport system ATP-binding protein
MTDPAVQKTTIIDLARVTKTFPPDIHALSDVSLRIRRGEMIFLTGQSGAGKTTLLRMLCGMDKPDKGYIEIAGQDLSRMTDAHLQKLRRRIGVAYQDFKLLPDKTVAQNIAYSMEVSYRSRQHIRSQIEYLLTALELQDKHNTLAGKLSRGEQQRVTIARAVANEPELILADEPTGNLDADTTALVMQLFRQCNAQGATLLIATHDASIYNTPRSKVIKIEKGHLALHKSSPKSGREVRA